MDYKNIPLWNSALPLEERLDYLIQELTLEEKFTMLGTGCPAIERLGIEPSHVGGEAAHGVQARHDQSFDKGKADYTTSFSQPIGMAASWDTALMKKIGEAVSIEARGLFNKRGGGSLSFWAPTIDMERDPRWGRTEEAYGEDPHLAGKMASAYIQGMRGEDSFYIRAACTLKHFYANNVEKDRTKITSSIDPRNMYEYYLEPFRIAVQEGGAEAVMTAYNAVNGVPSMCNTQVRDIVKEEWKLPGHVVCDGGAMKQVVTDHKYFDEHAKTVAAGLKAGIDCFTDDKDLVEAGARKAFAEGWISESDMDTAIRNSFRTRIRLGFFDGDGTCPYHRIPFEKVNDANHQQLARQMAAESVVLLKNENEMLPLRLEKGMKAAVIGPHADSWYLDWYGGFSPYTVTPFAAMQEWGRKHGVDVSWHNGCDHVRFLQDGRYIMVTEEDALALTPKSCKKEEAEKLAEVFEVTDWGYGHYTLRALSNGKLLTVEEGDGEKGTVRAKSKEAFGWFVRECFHMCPCMGEQEDGIIRGIKFELRAWNENPIVFREDGTAATCYDKKVKHGLYLRAELVRDGLAEAAQMAAESAVVIAAVGSHPMINAKEEVDREDIRLNARQHMLVQNIYQANPNTVMALITNYPYNIVWEQEHLSAIVTMSTGNMELGHGLVDILVGDTSPAARLPMTWYASVDGLPDMQDYDILSHPRTYWYYEKEVQYPFGYGMTYSRFSYEDLQVHARKEKEGLEISLKLTNVGNTVSDEVVQIYIAKENPRVKRPLKQLKAFVREKEVAIGECRNIEFFIPFSELCYYDVTEERMLLEDGMYKVMAGASSADIRQSRDVYICGAIRGKRNLFEPVKADHYDAHSNAECYLGCEGYTGVRVYRKTLSGKNVEKFYDADAKAQLFYQDVAVCENISWILFKAKAKKGAEITIQLDGLTICDYCYKDDTNGYEAVTGPIQEEWSRKAQNIRENMQMTITLKGEIELLYVQAVRE